MILYSVIGDNTKIHVTDNYLLAQLVEKDLKNDGFKKINIRQYSIDEFYLCFSFTVGNEWISLSAGSFQLNIHRGNWQYFRNSIGRWDRKQKDKGRFYHKIYGSSHIVCLTGSQREQLTQSMLQKAIEHDRNEYKESI